MIKNLLYVLAIAISTMSYGQMTQTITYSNDATTALVVSENSVFLDQTAPGVFSPANITITSVIDFTGDTEEPSHATIYLPLKSEANEHVFALDGGLTDANATTNVTSGTVNTRTWVMSSTELSTNGAAIDPVSGEKVQLKTTGNISGYTNTHVDKTDVTIVDPYYPAGYIAISNEQTVFPSVTRGETFTLSFDYVANTTITGLRYRILLVHPANGEEDPYANATIGDITHADITTTEGTLISGTSTVTYTFPLDATLNGLDVNATVDNGGNQIVSGSTADRYDLQKRNDTNDGWINQNFGLEFTTVNEAPVASVVGDAIENLKVYPNPTSDIINISNLEGIETISIYNTLGKLVKTVNGKTSINISELPSGIYILITNNGLKRKIVKK